MKLQVVGGGKMGEALLGGVLESGWATTAEVAVVELAPERCSELVDEYPGLTVGSEIHAGVDAIIAVKPQHVVQVATDLATANVRRLLSIAAGVRIETIQSAAPNAAVVRCMPNTPALVGAGASAISGGRHVGAEDLDWAESILGNVGIVIRVEEQQLDAVTGLSGSGPAYVFYLAEALTAAGVAEGLSPADADALTRQTLLGAARLLSETGEDPAVLRQNVTSPGGTTAAGLAVFADEGFTELVARVVRSAVARSLELGGG